jgi:hypothetical protein
MSESHTSHVTRHTSHVTRHKTHVTRHTSHCKVKRHIANLVVILERLHRRAANIGAQDEGRQLACAGITRSKSRNEAALKLPDSSRT